MNKLQYRFTNNDYITIRGLRDQVEDLYSRTLYDGIMQASVAADEATAFGLLDRVISLYNAAGKANKSLDPQLGYWIDMLEERIFQTSD